MGIGGAMVVDQPSVAAIFYVIGFLAVWPLLIWNFGFKQGKTGQTIGKGVMGIRVVRRDTGDVLGVGLSIGRTLLGSVLHSIACGLPLGWLWPLWDAED